MNPNGSDTTHVFNYVTTTAYGSSTPSQDAGSGSALVTVSARLSGLTPGTTYLFDFVATDSGGTVSTGDISFTTAPAGAKTGSSGVPNSPGATKPRSTTSTAWHLV
ncbi:MAG TPA: hypothetical protein VMU99_04475 [Acidimicrobiales bacterium]|nr:hypothetical protein [Acidimicrobiales bacterium]